MNWFLTTVDVLSALLLLAAALLIFLYAREFFMEHPPLEWYIVGAGVVTVAVFASLGFYRFTGTLRILVAAATLIGSLTVAYGFFRAYSRSTGGMR